MHYYGNKLKIKDKIMSKLISHDLKKFLLDNDLSCIHEDLINSDNGNNYFDFSTTDKSKISYLKGDRIPDDTSLLFDDEYRKTKAYHTKLGKLLSDDMKQNNNEDIQKVSTLLHNRAYKDDNNSDNLFLTKRNKRGVLSGIRKFRMEGFNSHL